MAPRGRSIKPIKGKIHEIYDKMKAENPSVTAGQVATAVRLELGHVKWPSNSAVSGLITEWNRPSIEDERDELWTRLSMIKYPLAPETLPVVLETWAVAFDEGIPLTIRQAQWVSRLYYVYKAQLINRPGLNDINDDCQITGQQAKKWLYKFLYEMSGLFPEFLVADLLLTARKTASQERAIRFEDRNYPSTREEILYYWLGDALLYGELPKSNQDIISRLSAEFSRTYRPDLNKAQEKNSGRKEKRDAVVADTEKSNVKMDAVS
jgi:hypothetical protein